MGERKEDREEGGIEGGNERDESETESRADTGTGFSHCGRGSTWVWSKDTSCNFLWITSIGVCFCFYSKTFPQIINYALIFKVVFELVHFRVLLPAFLIPFIFCSVAVWTGAAVHVQIRWIYLVSTWSSFPRTVWLFVCLHCAFSVHSHHCLARNL